jgi:AraC-like DNA-binding protein
MPAMPASQAPDAHPIPPEHAAHGAELVAEGPDGSVCTPDPTGRARPARLLLIEDDRDIVAMLEAVLRDYGFVLDTARDLIERHLAAPLSAAELAAAVDLSQRALARGVFALFGTSTHGYLREARLQRARRLLLDTDLPLKTFALEVGYRQTSDLTRAMAARFGATPTALRAGSGAAAPDEDA